MTTNCKENTISKEEEEEELRKAALEKLPTYDSLRIALLKCTSESSELAYKEVDVRRLGTSDRQQFIDDNFRVTDDDNHKFLQKLRDRLDKYLLVLLISYF